MKLHKFLKFAVACAAVCIASCTSVFAEPDDVSVRVDNVSINFDQAPVIENGRTLVPIRAVFESAGAEVSWEQETQTAILTKDNYIVTVKLGESFITKNGMPIAIDSPSQIINDRILIPVRAIAEAMDFGVTWNPVYRSVLIATNGKEYRPNSQWKTGFRPLKDHGFYVESSVSDLKFDLNNDNQPETITFKTAASDKDSAVLIIDGTDYSELMNTWCDAPVAIGMMDIIEKDKFTEIMIVDSNGAVPTAHFFRYNGFDLFELPLSQEGRTGIEFNETLFFDGIENIISDLDGLCFLDTMVCPGIYSLEVDEIKRYYLDCKASIGVTYSPKYNDNMAYYVYYSDSYVSGEYLNNDELRPTTVMVSELPKTMKILDMYMDSADPANFEFFVEFDNGKKAVLWPYSI